MHSIFAELGIVIVVAAALSALALFMRQPIIVAVTANAFSGDRERYLTAGMDDYLTKPIRMDELQELLERLAVTIEARSLSDQGRGAPSTLAS